MGTDDTLDLLRAFGLLEMPQHLPRQAAAVDEHRPAVGSGHGRDDGPALAAVIARQHLHRGVGLVGAGELHPHELGVAAGHRHVEGGLEIDRRGRGIGGKLGQQRLLPGQALHLPDAEPHEDGEAHQGGDEDGPDARRALVRADHFCRRPSRASAFHCWLMSRPFTGRSSSMGRMMSTGMAISACTQ